MKFILSFHTQFSVIIILHLFLTLVLYTNCQVVNSSSNCSCTREIEYNFKFPTLEVSGIPSDLTEIKCVAPYPLEISYSSFPSRNFEVKKDVSFINYTNTNGGFYENANYTFTLKLGLDLDPNLHAGVKNYSFVCQKKNDPCVYKRKSFTSGKDKGKFVVFEVGNLTESHEPLCFFPPEPQSPETNCTARFFYDKRRNEIWCENTDENENNESGLLNLDFCTSPDTCAHIFRHRRQIPAKCWTPVDCESDAKHCKKDGGKNLTQFKPFIAFCMKTDDTFSWSYSASGPFALRSDMYQNPPKLDFFNDRTEDAKIISMTNFSRQQLLGSRLQIKCSALAYFSSASFQFAVELKSTSPDLSLVFLPVSQNSTYDETLHLFSQVYTIHLDSLEIKSIFCFVGQRSSFNWFNVSRSVQIYDVLEFNALNEMGCSKNSPMHLNQTKKPQMVIQYLQIYSGMKKHSFSEESPVFQKLVNESQSVKLYCIADFPIQIHHQINSRDGAVSMEKFNSVAWSTDRHFNDKSAEEFDIGVYINLQWQRQFFRCESIENPCVQKTILYDFYERENTFNFSLVTKFPTLELGEIPEDGDFDGECDADFYYRPTKNDASSYEFCCKFPLDRNGVAQVNFYNCDSFLTCSNLFPRRRRDKKCWKSVPVGSSNADCTEFVKYTGFSPFLATCSSGSSENGDFFETDFGSLAFFGIGVSNDEKENNSLSIYFDENDVKSEEEMITIESFDPYQFLNESFTVRCLTSSYFTTGQILFGLELDEPQGQPSHFYEVLDSLKSGQKAFKSGTAQSGRIVCSSPLINKRKWVNSSRPFHIYARQNLEIFLSEDGVKIEMTVDEIEVDDLTVNKSITCHALGYPPAQISWNGPLGAVFNETKGIKNVSHVWSRIDFPKIYPNFEGRYNCTALNSMHHTDVKSIFLRVKSKSYTPQIVILITTFSLLLTIAAVFGGRHFLRMKREMELFKREREKFMKGDLDGEDQNQGNNSESHPNSNDPHSEIWKLPFDKKLEIPEDFIEMNKITAIGKGQFGVVYEGFVILADESNVVRERIHVAVKTLQRNADYATYKAFLEEIKIMSFIGEHENVVKLIGVSTEKIEKRQILVCVEYCQHSDLLQFLRNNNSKFWDEFDLEKQSSSNSTLSSIGSSETDNSSNYSNHEYGKMSLTTTALLTFAAEIANGMNHVESKNVIHGDLAARNILLSDNHQVKISDFGLSRQLLKPAIYAPKLQGFIPWAWRAIETLTGDCSYSVKSDVWSYAVLLVEIFSLGEEPYPHLKGLNKDFVDFLREGGHPERPKYANNQLYELMKECWRHEPENRPSFSEIHARILDLSSKIRAKHQLNTFVPNQLKVPIVN